MEFIGSTFEINWGLRDELSHGVILPWQESEPENNLLNIKWGEYLSLDRENNILWGLNQDEKTNLIDIPWGESLLLYNEHIVPWMLNEDVENNLIGVPWESGGGVDINVNIPWGEESELSDDKNIPWGASTFFDKENNIPWGADSQAIEQIIILPWGLGIPLNNENFITFNIQQFLQQEGDTGLTIRWKIKYPRVVIMNHKILFERYNENTLSWEHVPISGSGCNLGIDINSWLWDFSAALSSKEAAESVYPNTFDTGPVLTRLSLSGYRWLFFIEDVQQSYSYGNSNYQIRGYSKSKQLGSPYNLKQTKIFPAKTALEIINEELLDYNTLQGGATDWTAEYSTVDGWDDIFSLDWNVPANIYGVEDKTTVDIVIEVLKSIGGTVQSVGGLDALTYTDISDYETLKLLPLYPYAPNTWASQPPENIAATISLDKIRKHSISWSAAPGYNFVVVGGQKPGTYYKVRRAGTPADKVHSSIFDTLVLSDSVAKWRGRSILDALGYDKEIHTITIIMPPFSSGITPKLVFPGDLVEITDLFGTWRGQVTAININVNIKSGVHLTLTVEKHIIP